MSHYRIQVRGNGWAGTGGGAYRFPSEEAATAFIVANWTTFGQDWKVHNLSVVEVEGALAR